MNYIPVQRHRVLSCFLFGTFFTTHCLHFISHRKNMFEQFISPAFWPTAAIGLAVFFIIKKLMQTKIYTNFFLKNKNVILTEKSEPQKTPLPSNRGRSDQSSKSASSCESNESPTTCCKSTSSQNSSCSKEETKRKITIIYGSTTGKSAYFSNKLASKLGEVGPLCCGKTGGR